MRGCVSSRQQIERGLHDLRRFHHPRHRRPRPNLSAHDQHAERHRRRRGHGQARRRADHECRVCAISPDGARRQAGQSFSDFGGVVLANTSGETTLARLYAVGETSCTGVHGANRLASTSLLEGLTWGFYAAKSIQEKLASTAPPHSSRAGIGALARPLLKSIPDWRPPGHENLEDPALILQDWTTIQNTMWNYVGIVRSYERLKRAVADMRELGNRLTKYYHEATISKSIVELFHGQQMASIVAESAIRNPVSRGAHFRRD